MRWDRDVRYFRDVACNKYNDVFELIKVTYKIVENTGDLFLDHGVFSHVMLTD